MTRPECRDEGFIFEDKEERSMLNDNAMKSTRQKEGGVSTVKSLAYIVVGGLLLALLCGCGKPLDGRASAVERDTVTPAERVELKREVIEKPNAFPYRYCYYPDIGQIFAGNREGELVGLLWTDVDKKGRRQIQALYLIDPAQALAVKIVEPQSGFEVSRAALDDNWVAWVEKNKTAWRLYAQNRATKATRTVDEGEYFKEGGLDYPSPDLYNGVLVYDISTKTEHNMISRIIAENLNTGERLVLSEVEGINQYLGPPRIYADHVVWHRGEWTREMDAEVYLYDLADRKLCQLSTGGPAITPVIWGRHVVWNTYTAKAPENKDIVLYDIETGRSTLLTKAAHFEEYWGPSVACGIVTWNTNVHNHQPVLYVAATAEKRTFQIESSQTWLCGSWLTWRTAHKDRSGVFLLSLDSLFPVLSLTRPVANGALTKPPFPLETPLTPGRLAELTPPEVAALYLEAVKEGRYDLVAVLLADETGFASKEEYIADMKRDRARLLSYAVSREYVAIGNKACVSILESRYELADGTVMLDDQPVKWHMTKQEGIWKVDQLAAQ